ncbi:hypothetical protein V8D89_003707 [Ganoderma adspersum]
MSLVRATAPELLRPVEINDLALNTTLYYAADLSYTAIDIGLSSALFVLTPVSHLGARDYAIPLYMAALASHVVSVDRIVTKAQAGLFSEAFTTADVKAFESDVLKQSWMMTIALAIDVLIGDSIVWWRVCAVWRNRVVYCIGPLLIALTIAFGGKALWGVDHCLGSCRQPQFLLLPGVVTDISAGLSLMVNLIATGLIAYKAWAHWRLLRECLGRGHHKSRVVNALALLVESGAIYCILLLFLIVYEASPALFAEPGIHQSAFLRTIADSTYACWIYIIAIYPVLIIVIVALKWSPIEQGFVDSIHITGQSGVQTHFPSFARATTSTVEMTGTTHMVYVLDGPKGASKAAVKRASVDARTGTDDSESGSSTLPSSGMGLGWEGFAALSVHYGTPFTSLHFEPQSEI